MNATITHHLYAVQLFDSRLPEGENYCGCYSELVPVDAYERVQAAMVAANATTTRDEVGRIIRCFWTDPEEAEQAAERAEKEFKHIVAEVDLVRG